MSGQLRMWAMALLAMCAALALGCGTNVAKAPPGQTAAPKGAKKAVKTRVAVLEFYYLKDVMTENHVTAPWTMEHPVIAGEGYIFTRTDQDEGSDGGVTVVKIDSAKQPREVMDKVIRPKQNPPILTTSDVRPNVRVDLSPYDGPVLNINLNARGTKAFADFTRGRVGEILAVFVKGRLLTAPTIRDAITGGKAQVSGFHDLAEAQSVARQINAASAE